MDVRSELKADVQARAPMDAAAVERELSMDVQGAEVRLVWRTFEDGPNKYVLSYGWEVVKPAKGLTIEPLGNLNPVNEGTEAAAIERLTVRLRWKRATGLGTQMGELSYRIAADGTGGPT